MSSWQKALGWLAHWLAQTTLRTRLAVAFWAVAIASISTLTVVMALTMEPAVTRFAAKNMKIQVSSQALIVGNLLARHVATARALSLNKLLQDGIVEANAAYEGDEEAIRKQVAELDRSDRSSMKSRALTDAALELLELQSSEQGSVHEVVLVDRYGVVLASVDVTPDAVVTDKPWWRAAWNGGRGAIFVGFPESTDGYPERSLMIAVPVHAHSGGAHEGEPAIGVLGVVHKLDRLLNLLRETHVGRTDHTVLVLPTGLSAETNQPLEAAKLEGIRRLMTTDDDFAELTCDGEPCLQSAAPVRSLLGEPAVDRLGWVVAMHQHRDEIVSLPAEARRSSTLASLAVLGLAALLALWMARRIGEPIARIAQASRRIAMGDLSERVETGGSAEVIELARSFNVMANVLGTRIAREREAVAEAEKAREAEADARESLAEWNTTLEQMVADRTTELSRAVQAAEQARAIAESANRSKSEFLTNMSHELRTPLNAILGYSELLREQAEESGQRDLVPDLRRIHQAGSHLLSLVNDILDLSRVEAGRMGVHVERFEVAALVEYVTGTTRTLIEKNGSSLTVKIEGDVGAAHTDLTMVRQVLFNLLSNAAKFTERGAITLGVSREKERDRDWILFKVIDTGIGITPEQLARLFQPFTQADTSTTRKYGGTGLGLALSRRLCHLLGGEIEAHSSPGSGSTFIVRIPAEVAPQPPASEPSNSR